jgi:ribosome-binding factor A
MGTRRIARVNELIRDEVTEMLTRHLRDPRLTGLVSITAVETSPDLRHAKVYVSVYGDEDQQKAVMAALRSAAGFIRRELGERLRLRYIPEIQFKLDESIARGARILELLRQVQAQTQPQPHPPISGEE